MRVPTCTTILHLRSRASAPTLTFTYVNTPLEAGAQFYCPATDRWFLLQSSVTVVWTKAGDGKIAGDVETTLVYEEALPVGRPGNISARWPERRYSGNA